MAAALLVRAVRSELTYKIPASCSLQAHLISSAHSPQGVSPNDIVQFDRRACVGGSVAGSSFQEAYDSCFRLSACGTTLANTTFTYMPGGVHVVCEWGGRGAFSTPSPQLVLLLAHPCSRPVVARGQQGDRQHFRVGQYVHGHRRPAVRLVDVTGARLGP